MFDKQLKIGEGCDFQSIPEMLEKGPDGIHYLIKPEEYVYDHEIKISKVLALQTDDNEKLAVIKAPVITFDAIPKIFMVMTRIHFDGHINIAGGTTVSFEGCTFTSPFEDHESIVSVTSSSPTFRKCIFKEFPNHAVEYHESRGGIITDCMFRDIMAADGALKINKGARPLNENNKIKRSKK